ncbi:hypothetical protein CDAR_444331 [Caerostris darwini]|uniref:Uncharacterized protein n=1 Tax=Caerostris darwini TaxID=1538125 RepID=A0AAV4X7C7_9ARAC|nr:hypothetical protein CDAR_444331 [Caerostris darwini]
MNIDHDHSFYCRTMNQMDTNTEGNGPSQDPPQVLSPQDMDATTTNSKESEKTYTRVEWSYLRREQKGLGVREDDPGRPVRRSHDDHDVGDTQEKNQHQQSLFRFPVGQREKES